MGTVEKADKLFAEPKNSLSNQRLALEIALHAIQPVHTVLEMFCEAPEERGHLTVLKLVESTHDPVRLLAGLHVVDHTVQPQPLFSCLTIRITICAPMP